MNDLRGIQPVPPRHRAGIASKFDFYTVNDALLSPGCTLAVNTTPARFRTAAGSRVRKFVIVSRSQSLPASVEQSRRRRTTAGPGQSSKATNSFLRSLYV